ncbi:DUF3168 domain-containing protein [Cupriavidus taiwanensis]|uniref:DUF3168 domain-containing protein n=1 Tax=Cupriavidus taiwanensis TaxID=164546 RepID=UPI000E142D7E|nr:DUF3168 domain-containing protein [Cupriavidus taiwanensis]SPA17255.1 conserved hypothetical protein [Cupriavidus taiwanensis]
MTKTDLFSLIDAALPGRVFYMLAQQQMETPYIVFGRSGAESQNTLCGYAGLSRVRYLIDSYATVQADAVANLDAVKANLRAAEPEALIENEQDLFEPETRTYRCLIEVTTWDGES